VRARLSALAASGLDTTAYMPAAASLIGAAIPYDGVCIGTLDPDTELLTSHHKDALPEDLNLEWAQYEYQVEDVNHFTELARREVPVGLLHHDTGGDPQRSPRFRDLVRPHFDFGHELRVAFRFDGQTWGAATLYRSPSSPGFSTAEADVLGRLGPLMGLGLRTALVASSLSLVDAASGPGVLVIDSTNQVTQANPAATEWAAQLGGEVWGELPYVVQTAIAAARAHAAGRIAGVPQARLRTPAGRWLVVHASPLASRNGDVGSVVVTIEEASAPDIVPLVIAAFGLTGREREVIAQVLQGAPTSEIAQALHLSPHTVQDHLKAIFDKAGVRSRRALMARVFFDHYQPRRESAVSPSGRLLAS